MLHAWSESPEYGAFYTAMYTAAYIKSTRTLCIRVYVVCIRCILYTHPSDYMPIVPTIHVDHRTVHFRDWEPGYAELWRRWRLSFRPPRAPDPTPHLPQQHTGVYKLKATALQRRRVKPKIGTCGALGRYVIEQHVA